MATAGRFAFTRRSVRIVILRGFSARQGGICLRGRESSDSNRTPSWVWPLRYALHDPSQHPWPFSGAKRLHKLLSTGPKGPINHSAHRQKRVSVRAVLDRNRLSLWRWQKKPACRVALPGSSPWKPVSWQNGATANGGVNGYEWMGSTWFNII